MDIAEQKIYKNRGMLFEKIINTTINFYKQNKLALFHKKELTFKFQKIEKNDKRNFATNSYISEKSTVDYYGIYKGIFIAFEAKSVEEDLFAINQIKKHQWKYLENINYHSGVAFLFIFFKNKEKIFLIPFKNLEDFQNKKKHIKISDASKIGIPIEIEYPGIIDFLHVLDQII